MKSKRIVAIISVVLLLAFITCLFAACSQEDELDRINRELGDLNDEYNGLKHKSDHIHDLYDEFKSYKSDIIVPAYNID